jgi:hypothetical protein
MIVGVYGIGYLLAAMDPVRHWPIVLVGLLGKIFGPIGFLFSAVRSTLPITFGMTIVTNDLIWWAPFAMILWHAFRSEMAPPPTGDDGSRAIDSIRSDHGQTLSELSQGRPILVTFLRHSGCVFYREAVADLMQLRAQLVEKGVRIALVQMGPVTDHATCSLLGATPDISRFSDPDCRLYREFGLKRGTAKQLFGPAVWWPGFKAILRGHGIGKLDGDGCQLGGTFLIRDGQIVAAYRCHTSADHADYLALADLATPGASL